MATRSCPDDSTMHPASSTDSKVPANSLQRRARPDGLADARGALEPVGADRGEPGGGELRLAAGVGGRQKIQKRLRAQIGAGLRAHADRRDGARLELPRLRRLRKVDAEADGEMRVRLRRAFQQDARDLPAAEKHVVGPLDLHRRGAAGKPGKHVVKRQRRHEGPQPQRARTLGGGDRQRRRERPLGVDPRPPPPPPRGALAQRQNPLRPGQPRGDPRRLGVGAVGLGEDPPSVALRPACALSCHRPSDPVSRVEPRRPRQAATARPAPPRRSRRVRRRRTC